MMRIRTINHRDVAHGFRLHISFPVRYSLPPVFRVFCYLLFSTFIAAQDASNDLRFTRDSKLLLTAIEPPLDPYRVAKACQRLAEVGGDDAVEKLGKLLPHPDLSNYGRHALEGIASEKAKAELRKQLNQAKGKELVGLIHSIGRVRDNAAVDDLLKLAIASTTTQETREVIAKAFLLIGSQESLAAITKILPSNSLSKLPSSSNHALELDSLLSQLRSTTPGESFAAVRRLRNATDNRETLAKQLLEKLSGLPSEARLPVLQAIESWKLKLDSAAVLGVVRDESAEVRASGIRLAAPGATESMIATYFNAAGSEEWVVAIAAKECLIDWLTSIEIDPFLITMTSNQEQLKRLLAVELIGERRILAATPRLVEMLDKSSGAERIAVIRSLGGCCDASELPRLLLLATDSLESPDRTAAREAIRLACIRLPQQACAEAIASTIPKSDEAAKNYLFEQLTSVGGEVAMTTVVRAAKSSDPVLQDLGTKSLGEWSTPDAAESLRELAQNLTNAKYQTRAIRAYLRIAKQLDIPMASRVEICRNAITISDRPEEQSLALAVLKQYPSLDGLDVAASLLDREKGGEAVCATIVAMATKLIDRSPDRVKPILRRVSEVTQSLELKNACSRFLGDKS